jgi:hypothetical protein
MNSGFYPKVLMPTCYSVQTQSQQLPFYFGASNVPYDLAMNEVYFPSSGIPDLHKVSHEDKPNRRRKKKDGKK